MVSARGAHWGHAVAQAVLHTTAALLDPAYIALQQFQNISDLRAGTDVLDKGGLECCAAFEGKIPQAEQGSDTDGQEDMIQLSNRNIVSVCLFCAAPPRREEYVCMLVTRKTPISSTHASLYIHSVHFVHSCASTP